MYVPLQLRLTLLYALLLGLALLVFGNIVYTQAQQRAYNDLDATLSSRAASVRIGKDLVIGGSTSTPFLLPGVDQLGAGGVSIEVLDSSFHLLATTSNNTSSASSLTPRTNCAPLSPLFAATSICLRARLTFHPRKPMQRLPMLVWKPSVWADW